MGRKKQINLEKQSLMEKILLYLGGCADASFSYRFEKMFGITGRDIRALIKKDKKGFNQSITDLKKLKFIEKKKRYDGSVLISLTEKGKSRELKLRFKKLGRKKDKWDGKWRMVAFDVPEECKKARNALRYRLGLAGFFELQKSLFLYPYDCEKEIIGFVKLFKLEKFVRFALIDYIDNQERIKSFFRLKNQVVQAGKK